MSEARKLDGTELPDIPIGLDGGRPRSRDPVPIKDSAGLPPLPAVRSLEPRPMTAEAVPKSAPPRRVAKAKASGGVGRAVLVLVLVGATSFSVAAAGTAAIVLGSFDVKAGWIKEKLSGVKSLVQQLR